MQKIVRFISASIMVLFCQSALAVDIQHELGSTRIDTPPQRIVVLEFSFIDALAAVGIAPVGIADDKKRDRVIPAYTNIIGDEWVSVGTRKTPSLEIIASLQPDLIIADKKRHAAAYDSLSQIAPTIVLDSLGGDYHAAVAQMTVIGEAVGKSAAMARRVAEHKARMADFIDQISNISDKYSAQFGVANANGLWLHSPLSYNGSLLKMFGFKSNMENKEGSLYEKVYVGTNLEQLSQINPDILLVGEYTDPSYVDGLAGEALYKDLAAVRNQRLFNVTAHNWSRLRGMLAAELTAEELLATLQQLN